MKMTGIEKGVIAMIIGLGITLLITGAIFLRSTKLLIDEIGTKGLKGITEEIWEGKPKDALSD